ncbi:MAG TPA: HgcAB-associated protein [Candidatus Bathyarchaeia archaeon]|nr:HgcAB-associated protein [Candidatus Bathyarchaeia archaeon]
MSREASRHPPGTASQSSCKVEAVVSVDERGQMVLPKELRERAHIRSGDKLAAVSCERHGEVCCISLIKVEELSATVKGFLGPIFSELK